MSDYNCAVTYDVWYQTGITTIDQSMVHGRPTLSTLPPLLVVPRIGICAFLYGACVRRSSCSRECQI